MAFTVKYSLLGRGRLHPVKNTRGAAWDVSSDTLGPV
jgi:hypothetical protein